MERNVLLFLYQEFVAAVDFCNDVSKELGEEGFDTSELPEKFTLDIIPLSFYAICADGVVTEGEIKNLNAVAAHLGRELSKKDGEGALEIVKNGHFEIPVTLVMFTLRAYYKVSAADQESKDAVLKEQLDFIDTVLYLYADLMCSVVEKLASGEKLVILTCLQTCCEYVTSILDAPCRLSDEILALIG